MASVYFHSELYLTLCSERTKLEKGSSTLLVLVLALDEFQ